jgi:hypothetical protein
MNEVEEKDVPDVSGGASSPGGCFPKLPGYPASPGIPFPGPVPVTTDEL